MNVFHFLVVLGLAIIFHEWGHFIVAKLSGAKVDEFAVGFGKKLFTYRWHETEYSVRVMPLGGLVKIRGMDFDEELTGAEWEFLQLPAWKRILIVVAGPMMNFVLAYLIYVLLLLSFGKPFTATTTVGYIPSGSWGWEMGLHDGDKILSVNGTDVSSWDEIATLQYDAVLSQSNEKLTLSIDRNGTQISKAFTIPNHFRQANREDEEDSPKPPEEFEGIFITNVVKDGPADRVGLKPGFSVLSTNGERITQRGQWSDIIFNSYTKLDDGSYHPEPMTLVCHDLEGATQTLTVTPILDYPADDAIPYQPKPQIYLSYNDQTEITVKEYFTPATAPIGISPKLQPVIGTVLEGSPAGNAGLTSGCRIVKMNDQDIDDWVDVLHFLHSAPTTKTEDGYTTPPIELTWFTPDNEMKETAITPNVIEQPLLTSKSMKTGKNYVFVQLGIDRQSDRKKMGIIGSIKGGWNSMMRVFDFMYDFLYKLFTGGVSPKLLGGPIAIFQLSGETGRWGLERFLSFIALLSVNLGILNLFPLPPLDGGHTVFYTAEIIRRKPLTMKQMETFSKIGFALIIPLFVWLIFNDLSRIDFLGWIKGLFTFNS